VLVHEAQATAVRNYPEVKLPSLPELMRAYEEVCRPVRPARVAAVAINTAALDERAARAELATTEHACEVVADDVIRFGPDRVLDALLAALGIA
jgi:uncharacterized NAD-dependent epimerase/dehydratase family protein